MNKPSGAQWPAVSACFAASPLEAFKLFLAVDMTRKNRMSLLAKKSSGRGKKISKSLPSLSCGKKKSVLEKGKQQKKS
jgi:hypothetical protein